MDETRCDDMSQGNGSEWTTPRGIRCCMEADTLSDVAAKPAVQFLKEYGVKALVSLGCGRQINRIDNHLRLMNALNLIYYVGIDCGPYIEPVSENMFMAPDEAPTLIAGNGNQKPRKFWGTMRLFPGTFVEELSGVHCAAIVCQRVYPDCRWEDTIISMNPLLVLQEDLHGCERQRLRGSAYVRNWSKIRSYELRSFRPWPIFPGEKNLILWQRRDLCGKNEGRYGWLQRISERFIG